MKYIYQYCIAFVLVLFAHPVFAQLTISISTTSSTCSSNGTITINASGGTLPITYEILSGPPGFSRPSQTSNIFTSIPPGNYVIQVTDGIGQTATGNASVTGNYVPPSIQSCAVSGSRITVTARDGRLPYSYAISSDGGASFSPPQTSNVFDCLPAGDYTIRVIDACNNFFPCQSSVTVLPPRSFFSCTPVSPGITNIRVTSTIQGEAPYNYRLESNDGQVYNNTTGIFNNIPGCSYKLTVFDRCGKFTEYPNITCIATDIKIGVACVNFSDGTATITASGGVPPYRFFENRSGQTNTTGVFAGLPTLIGGNDYRFVVQDACANTSTTNLVWSRFQPRFNECPFDSTITIVPAFADVIRSDSCPNPAVPCPYFFYPVTITCTNCPAPQTIVIDRPSRFDPFPVNEARFTGLAPGIRNFTVTDACGTRVQFSPNYVRRPIALTVQTSTYCQDRTVRVRRADGSLLPAGSDVTLLDAGNNIIAQNTTGNFVLARPGNYTVRVLSPGCAQGTATFSVSNGLTANVFCDSLNFVPCPNIAGYTFQLIELPSGNLLQTTTNRGFAGLQSGRDYRIIATNPAFQDSILFNFTAASLAPAYVADSITCSSLIIKPQPADFVLNAAGNIPPRYLIFNAGGNQIRDQLSPEITGLSPGNYSFQVVHPVCGTRSGSVVVPAIPSPSFCINPSETFINNPNANRCGFGWDVLYTSGTSEIRVSGGPDNVNLSFDGNGTYNIRGLAPGTYQVQTECGVQSFTLPASPLKVEAQALSTCPGQGRISAQGAFTTPQWANYINAQGLQHCGAGLSTTYRLRSFAGAVIAQNTSGVFADLQPGLTYKVDLMAANCRLDSIEITIPFYVRPQLSATFGAVCGSPAVATVQLSVTGGNPPFRYEIVSPGGFPAVNSPNRSVQFNNLPAGTYIYRVVDSCGISSDFSSGVDVFNFTPRFRRLCRGGIQLEAPIVIGASYTWTNGAGQVVGTTASPIVPDNGADTYTISIQLGACSYVQTVNVPLQTLPSVFANAGPDIVDTTFTTQLQGINPNNPNVTNFWFQTAPSSGTTIFSNFSDPRTNVTVSQYPGQYTYVWIVDGGDNGCTDYDTITVILVECPSGISDLTANVILTPTSCTAADGAASVVVTSPGTVFSYFWSNGGRNDNISGLLPGNYTIQVTDGDFCTRDFFREVEVVPALTLVTDTVVDICEGQRFRVGNKFYDQTGSYVDTLQSLFLCDSVILTNLTVRPIERITADISICAGETFDFNGTLLSVQGTYLDTLKSIFTCDSIVTLNLTVNPVKDTTIFREICANEFFVFGGDSLNVPGLYTDSLLTFLGCDSIVFLDLTVFPVQTTLIDTTICEGEIYNFNGQSLTLAGVYIDTLATFLSCDSIITLDLKVLPLSTAPLNVAICEGESFTFNGVAYDSTGSFVDTLINFLGCDSIVTLNLTVNPVKQTVLDVTICSDAVYDFAGQQLNTTGTYTDLLTTFLNCDSLVTLNLTVVDVLFTVLDEAICEGETFSFNGVGYNQSGSYTDTLVSSVNCDSIVTLNLLVKPILRFDFEATICERDTFDFNGMPLTSAGIYVDTILGSNDCDSIITLELFVNPSPIIVLNEDICDGDAFDFDGDPLTVSGTYNKVLSTFLGCDSIVTVNLTVFPVQVTNLADTICSNQTYNFNGALLNIQGLYSDTLVTFLGCDSIVNLSLTVNPIATTTISDTICQGQTFDFNGRPLTAPGVYVDTLPTFQGCDSVITLTLTVNPVSAFDFTISICEGESYDFNGTILSDAGIYTQVLNNFVNCDSTITLTLVVNPIQRTTLNEAICTGETFDFIGDLLNSTGTYTKVLSTFLNCDSIVTLNLTVFDISVTTLNETICNNQFYNFNGANLNQTGQYFDTLLNFVDCDSIVILNLTVNPIQTSNIQATICEGEIFDFLGSSLTISGVYRDTLRTFQNCDSIIILSLTVNPRTFFSFNAAICDGEQFDFFGQSLTSSGIYIDTIRNFQGCDSVVTLNLAVNPVRQTFLTDTICEGDTYNFIGDLLTLPGNYSRVLRTYLDCDSTVNLSLTVLPRSFTTVSGEICEGTFYDFNGVLYGETGIYFDTLQNFLNCDSIITLNLNVLPRQRVSIEGFICDNEQYDFNGVNFNQAGIYIDTLPDINGCDSIITLNLTVYPTYVLSVTDSFCTGDLYPFDNDFLTEGGIYNAVLTTQFGCDSTVQLTLLQRNIPTVDLGLDTFLCARLPLIYNLPLEQGTLPTWQDGSNLNPYSITTRGSYRVIVSNICGEDEDDVLVNAGCDGCDVYLPSAFTPNNDGLNDRFIPQYGCEPTAVLDFWVADRWGNIIFRTNQLGEGWDGTWKGQPSPMDNYLWFIRMTFELNGQLREKTDRGAVLVIR